MSYQYGGLQAWKVLLQEGKKMSLKLLLTCVINLIYRLFISLICQSCELPLQRRLWLMFVVRYLLILFYFQILLTSSFETHCTIMIWTIYICYLRKCSSLFLITSIILWFITPTTLEKGFFVHIMEGSYLHVFFIFCCLCLIFLWYMVLKVKVSGCGCSYFPLFSSKMTVWQANTWLIVLQVLNLC